MGKIYEQLSAAYSRIRAYVPFVPQTAIILGSGFGGFADSVAALSAIPYSAISGFPRSTVDGHKGQFVFARISGLDVVIMQGRVHYYEGYTMQQTVMPVRMMRMFGADKLIVTNSAGGINQNFAVGDIMMIDDHINLAPNPLIGENSPSLGVRFPDMTRAYDPRLKEALVDAAAHCNIELKRGTYCQVTGPSFETPSEIKYMRAIGADAVGMSTACEVVAAVHCGFRVCGLSFISNSAAGMTGEALSHEEVNRNAQQSGDKLSNLLRAAVAAVQDV